MKRYKVFKDNVCTNQWTSDFAGADYYEPSFGEPGSYDVREEDITAELAAKSEKAMRISEGVSRIKALKEGDIKTLPELEKIVLSMAELLGLK